MFVEKGDVDSKMLSALLTGVNRAYPFAEGNTASSSHSVACSGLSMSKNNLCAPAVTNFQLWFFH